ncbi:hypothetical protein OpiT1DRAFT_01582 [Opitutaceae bacterium TAV1]|nr:hypothetical protein OpiT1DRAFT_01582 [Opitutaceae bacterium TAV1]
MISRILSRHHIPLIRTKTLAVLVAGAFGIAAGTATARADAFVLNDTFTPGSGTTPGNPVWVPLQPASEFRFWYAAEAESWVWQGSEKADANYHIHPLHAKSVPGSQTLRPWLHRSLSDGSPSTQALRKPTLRADVAMRWGDDKASGLAWALALLNADGKGYVAEVARSGRTALFRVDGSLTDPDGWIQIGTGQGDSGNRQVLSLSVIDGQVRLNTSLRRGIIAAAADSTYDTFTGIALSSFVNGGVFMVVYGVNLTGEPSAE